MLQRYKEGELSRAEIKEVLGVGKTRFFVLAKTYRQSPEVFSIANARSKPRQLGPEVEAQIAAEFQREKQLQDLHVMRHNRKKCTFDPGVRFSTRLTVCGKFGPEEIRLSGNY